MPIFRERNSETAVPCLGVWCDGTYAAVAVGHAFYPSGARFECMLRLERMLTEQHADPRKNFRSSFKPKLGHVQNIHHMGRSMSRFTILPVANVAWPL